MFPGEWCLDRLFRVIGWNHFDTSLTVDSAEQVFIIIILHVETHIYIGLSKLLAGRVFLFLFMHKVVLHCAMITLSFLKFRSTRVRVASRIYVVQRTQTLSKECYFLLWRFCRIGHTKHCLLHAYSKHVWSGFEDASDARQRIILLPYLSAANIVPFVTMWEQCSRGSLRYQQTASGCSGNGDCWFEDF